MNPQVPASISSLGEFFAHALELEHESAEHYRQLAQTMAIHHNPELAGLFSDFARYSRERAERIQSQAQGIPIPEIAPWEFKWNCPGNLQTDCLDQAIHYQMSVSEALQFALHNERRRRDFYTFVAKDSPDAQVRQFAEEIAREESARILRLEEERAERSRSQEPPTPEDLDPPNMPD